jgi:6-phosphogluconolactonase
MIQAAAQLFVGAYGDRGLYSLALGGDGSLAAQEFSNVAANASFGAYSARHRLLYLVDEREEGALGAYRWLGDKWAQLGRVPSHGSLPCFVSLDPGEAGVAVANYGDGSCAYIRLDPETGLPSADATVRSNYGGGPVEDRQEGPHAHCAVFSPDARWLYQTDLGTDEIRAFRLDPAGGTPGEAMIAWRAPPGTGPRHLVFHPSEPVAVLVSELASTVTLFNVGEGKLAAMQTLSTLPPGYLGDSLGGHLAFNTAGDRLYVTNRGHDTIAVFALDNGRLRLIDHIPAGGASPRFFLLIEDEARMLVANEEGDSITSFDLLPDGTLSQCGEARIPKPAFIFSVPDQREN